MVRLLIKLHRHVEHLCLTDKPGIISAVAAHEFVCKFKLVAVKHFHVFVTGCLTVMVKICTCSGGNHSQLVAYSAEAVTSVIDERKAVRVVFERYPALCRLFLAVGLFLDESKRHGINSRRVAYRNREGELEDFVFLLE